MINVDISIVQMVRKTQYSVLQIEQTTGTIQYIATVNCFTIKYTATMKYPNLPEIENSVKAPVILIIFATNHRVHINPFSFFFFYLF